MPFNDLPLEIIQSVFSLCCQSFTIPRGPYRSRSGTTQATLLLVCSRWREIALNTSALWGHGVVICKAGNEQARGPTSLFQFVRYWLNRAGSTSIISLKILVIKASESEIIALSYTLLSSFCVTNLDLESYHSFLLVPTKNSSHLERLHLSLYKPARETDTFPCLPNLPSLKELRLCLDLDCFRDLTNIYLIPWHQLRVFTLRDNPWPSQVLLNILQRCKLLVDCTLVVKLQYQQHEHSIILPNLESLVLKIDSKGGADSIIRSLTLPNLRSLDIRSSIEATKLSLSPEAIIIMAQRSGFKERLTDFSLSLMDQPVDVMLLLGSMPAVERVQLIGPLMFQPGTFDDLSSGTIGPRLEEICFGDMSDEEIGLLFETVGQRHEKAKAMSDIRPFSSIACYTSGSELESHKQRAEQCSEAFKTNVAIVTHLDV